MKNSCHQNQIVKWLNISGCFFLLSLVIIKSLFTAFFPCTFYSKRPNVAAEFKDAVCLEQVETVCFIFFAFVFSFFFFWFLYLIVPLILAVFQICCIFFTFENNEYRRAFHVFTIVVPGETRHRRPTKVFSVSPHADSCFI